MPVEARTRAWLESSYRAALERLAAAHEPVWSADGRPRRLNGYAFKEIHRKLKIFRWLDRLRFDSFLDVGSGFDAYPSLVAERYGATGWFSDFTHAMNLPYLGGRSGRLDRAVTLNAARLPFADGAFDVVLASEVLEHLVRPIEVIAELVRVSRVAVVMTSLEALSPRWTQRWRAHWSVDVTQPHVERNFFVLPELEAVFGADWRHENLFLDHALPASSFSADAAQDAAYAEIREVESLVDALHASTARGDHGHGAMGILIVKPAAGVVIADPPAQPDRNLTRWLIAAAVAHERFTVDLANAVRNGDAGLPAVDRPVAAALCDRLRCPDCRGPVESAANGLRCPSCQEGFAAEYGVPIMYPQQPLDALARPEQAVQQLCNGDARRERTVRRVLRRLRRNEQPAGRLRRMSWRLLRSGL